MPIVNVLYLGYRTPRRSTHWLLILRKTNAVSCMAERRSDASIARSHAREVLSVNQTSGNRGGKSKQVFPGFSTFRNILKHDYTTNRGGIPLLVFGDW